MLDPKAVSNQPTKESSLVKDSELIGGRLANTLERVSRISDALHGSRPRGLEGGDQPGKPESSVRHSVDSLDRLCSDIDTELSYIEQRL
jgi:hypothetical protein